MTQTRQSFDTIADYARPYFPILLWIVAPSIRKQHPTPDFIKFNITFYVTLNTIMLFHENIGISQRPHLLLDSLPPP